MASDDPPALEVRGLEAGYQGIVVLRDVCVDVLAGSVVALLGPNGAGKSTLLRSVSGLLRARRGEIRLHGRDVTTMRPHRRANAGLCHIPEGRGIYRTLTVRENIILQAHPDGASDAVERAVSAFPVLGQRLKQRAGTMSGGQQQMLAFAAAHVRQPSLLLVDEPSLGLAPIVIDEIFEFLQQRALEGTATLMVDQLATRALALADRGYVLRNGQIVYGGSARSLLESDLFGYYINGHEETSAAANQRIR